MIDADRLKINYETHEIFDTKRICASFNQKISRINLLKNGKLHYYDYITCCFKYYVERHFSIKFHKHFSHTKDQTGVLYG